MPGQYVEGSTEVSEGSVVALCIDGGVSVLECQHQLCTDVKEDSMIFHAGVEY
jgi:hypothetical protein